MGMLSLLMVLGGVLPIPTVPELTAYSDAVVECVVARVGNRGIDLWVTDRIMGPVAAGETVSLDEWGAGQWVARSGELVCDLPCPQVGDRLVAWLQGGRGQWRWTDSRRACLALGIGDTEYAAALQEATSEFGDDLRSAIFEAGRGGGWTGVCSVLSEYALAIVDRLHCSGEVVGVFSLAPRRVERMAFDVPRGLVIDARRGLLDDQMRRLMNGLSACSVRQSWEGRAFAGVVQYLWPVFEVRLRAEFLEWVCSVLNYALGCDLSHFEWGEVLQVVWLVGKADASARELADQAIAVWGRLQGDGSAQVQVLGTLVAGAIHRVCD